MSSNGRNKAKKFWTAGKIGLTIIILILAIVVPIGLIYLNECWEEWPIKIGIDDILSIYTTTLGTIGAIYSLCMTILYTQHESREQYKKSIKPFLVSNVGNCDSEKEIKQFDADSYVLYEKTGEEYEWIQYEEVDVNSNGNCLFAIKYTLENIGLGNSLVEYISINDHPCISYFTLCTGQKYSLLLLSDPKATNNQQEIRIGVIYEDIAGIGKYKQQETVTIRKVGESGIILSYEGQGSTFMQEELNK